VQKTWDFLKIDGVPLRTRVEMGLSQGGNFVDKRGGQFFAILQLLLNGKGLTSLCKTCFAGYKDSSEKESWYNVHIQTNHIVTRIKLPCFR